MSPKSIAVNFNPSSAGRWGLQPNARRWGVNITPPLLTQKRRVVEIHRRRQSVSNQTLLLTGHQHPHLT